jgi:hypothetical protein
VREELKQVANGYLHGLADIVVLIAVWSRSRFLGGFWRVIGGPVAVALGAGRRGSLVATTVQANF